MPGLVLLNKNTFLIAFTHRGRAEGAEHKRGGWGIKFSILFTLFIPPLDEKKYFLVVSRPCDNAHGWRHKEKFWPDFNARFCFI